MNKKNINVSATKSANKGILGNFDRGLVGSFSVLVRSWGWWLLFLIAYLSFFDTFGIVERKGIYVWSTFFAAYLLLLEIIRFNWKQIYNSLYFRIIGILFNLCVLSVLIHITSSARFLFVFAYFIPIFTAIVYFAERGWVKVGVLFIAVLGLYLAGIVYANSGELTFLQFLILTSILIVFSFGFDFLLRRATSVPNRLTEIARELHKSLDLQLLMREILQNAIVVTQAQRGLIIVINPRSNRYVGHYIQNFPMREDRSVEDLARKCFVLVHGLSFEVSDLQSVYNNKSLYHEFFESQPRSILAEPLYNPEGKVIGVINVARDNPNEFDRISKRTLREFSFLISTAIENSIVHREVILREAQSREISEKFALANSEDEVIQALAEEVRHQIPQADRTILHRYLPNNGELLPVGYISSEDSLKNNIWSASKPIGEKTHLRVGYGIAGHALEMHDTILVSDVDNHPWYVKLNNEQNIRSLLVAPLFNLDSKHTELYGTLSLDSASPSKFDLNDETILTRLSTQASLAIAKIREFQEWREQGGTLRKVLEQIRLYDIQGSEEALCNQIAQAATRLLGFKVARIRLLSENNALVTVAISGLSQNVSKKLIGMQLPYPELEKFLSPSYKVESSFLIQHGDSLWKEFASKYFYIPQDLKDNKEGWMAFDALLTPLIDSSGTLFGLLTLDVPNTGTIPNQQVLESIGVFASSASWIIELSRYQRRLMDQQHRMQSFIATISQELAGARDFSTICEIVVQVGAKLLSAEGCSLLLVRGKDLELAHSNYLAKTDYISRSKPISTQPKSGLTAWVAATGEILCFNNQDYKTHVAWAGETNHLLYLPSKSCQSLLLAPIKDKEGKVIGVLTLENKRTLAGIKGFNDEDKSRLVTLANEFARALEVIGHHEDAKDWERTGIADDLHDLINWYHSGVVMWIAAMAEWLKRGNIEKVNELMPELLRHSHTTVLELKTLHTNVLTKSLEADSLQQALHETVLAWVKRTVPKYKEDMKIHLDCPRELEIPIGMRNTMIRIASLAFSNAIQHSGIIENSKIEISIIVQQVDNIITMSVIDTGHGMVSGHLEGYGLPRMMQLAEKLNSWNDVKSDFKIVSNIDRGTKVVLRLEFLNQKAIL